MAGLDPSCVNEITAEPGIAPRPAQWATRAAVSRTGGTEPIRVLE